MIRSAEYEVNFVETNTFSDTARLLDEKSLICLLSFLAIDPQRGELVAGAAGIRCLEWPLDVVRGRPRKQVVYFFRDLNMPLYLLSVNDKTTWIHFDEVTCAEFALVADELINEHFRFSHSKEPA